jgi:hypothetical protein
MINHINQIVVSSVMADELLRLARLDREWVEYRILTPEDQGYCEGTYAARYRQDTWLKSMWALGHAALWTR